MRHLFIVNPVCSKIKNRAESVVRDIGSFMSSVPEVKYDIHVTRWQRDALGFCRKYIQQADKETVRVHIFGGTGTVFEIVNAVVDLPDAEIACYPMGRTNTFLHYFGRDKAHLFASIKEQVNSKTINVDALRCNHNYGISNVLIGLEAYVDNRGDKLIESTHMNSDLCYTLVAAPRLLKRKVTQFYSVTLDGESHDGDYITIMSANQPWYSQGLHPAVDARPDDGLLDVYMLNDCGMIKRLPYMICYLTGRYMRFPEMLTHKRGRVLEIKSDQNMWLSVDGETFFSNNITCELLPGAIRFVCPDGVSERSGE